MDCLCILTRSIVMVNICMCQFFVIVGDRALYNGRQHNCQDPRPTVNTLVAGRGKSRSSVHNLSNVAITQLVIGSHLFINLEMLPPNTI
jgi:hypothetical protein